MSVVEAELRQNCAEPVLIAPPELHLLEQSCLAGEELLQQFATRFDASVTFIASSSVCRAWNAANIIFSSSPIDRSPVSSGNYEK